MLKAKTDYRLAGEILERVPAPATGERPSSAERLFGVHFFPAA